MKMANRSKVETGQAPNFHINKLQYSEYNRSFPEREVR